jgi:hypothetical protein
VRPQMEFAVSHATLLPFLDRFVEVQYDTRHEATGGADDSANQSESLCQTTAPQHLRELRAFARGLAFRALSSMTLTKGEDSSSPTATP